MAYGGPTVAYYAGPTMAYYAGPTVAYPGPTSSIEGVEFIYDDANSKPNKTLALYKSNDSNTVELGRWLLAPDHPMISRTHARLTFEDFKVSITDLGSVFGTWVQSKKGRLAKNTPYALEDGDRIVFGADEDRGRTKDAGAVRVKVKFLRERPAQGTKELPPPPPLRGTDNGKTTLPPFLEAAKKELLEAPHVKRERRGTPEPKSIRPSNQLRRTRSLDIPSAFPANTSHTKLDGHIQMPWSDKLRLGYGVNALTGEFVNTSALYPVQLRNKTEQKRERTFVERLQWKDVKGLQDEIELGFGATMNFPCPLGANVKIASVLSDNISSSTIIIQYKVEGSFLPEYIPDKDVRLREGLEKLSDREFREKFGDYYIAGYQRTYSCRMIVVCKFNEQTVTERHEEEAKVFVTKYFEGGIKAVDAKNATTGVSLISVIIDAEGCSVDPNQDFVQVEDAPRKLLKTLKNAHGVPRIAYLYHYGTLEPCKLSRRVEVGKDMFQKARSMRAMYAHLQASLLHSALKEYGPDCRAISAVLRRFEDQRGSIVSAIKGDKTMKNVEALDRELAQVKAKAERLIRQHELIRSVRDMDKSIVSHPPRPFQNGGGTSYYYRWDCGIKPEATKKFAERKEYNLVDIVAGEHRFAAFEIRWKTPKDVPGSWREQLRRLRSRVVSFETQSRREDPPAMSFYGPPQPGLRRSAQPAASDDRVYNFVLADHDPCYILGWSLSCYWPEGKDKSEPVIKMLYDYPSTTTSTTSLTEGRRERAYAPQGPVQKRNCILSDRLEVSVDTSRPVTWHCQVTVVPQAMYNFPDLFRS